MGKIIVLAAIKGGSGKSTLARNISLWLSEHRGKTAAVDLDPQGSLDKFCSDRAERTGKLEVGIEFIPRPEGLKAKLENISKENEWVVCDVGGRDTIPLRVTLAQASAVLVPVRPGQEDIDSFADLMAAVDEIRASMNENLKVYVIMNQCPIDLHDQLAPSVVKGLREEYGDEIIVLDTRLRHRKAWSKSRFAAQAIWEHSWSDQANQEFQRMVSELTKKEVF